MIVFDGLSLLLLAIFFAVWLAAAWFLNRKSSPDSEFDDERYR